MLDIFLNVLTNAQYKKTLIGEDWKNKQHICILEVNYYLRATIVYFKLD